MPAAMNVLILVLTLAACVIVWSRGQNMNGMRAFESFTGVHSLVPREIGAVVAHRNRFPYVAQVVTRAPDGRTESCTGTLITPWVVLTCLHCFELVQPGQYGTLSVYIGQGDNQMVPGATLAGLERRGVQDMLHVTGTPATDFAFVILNKPVMGIPVPKVSGLTTPQVPLTNGMPVASLGFGLKQDFPQISRTKLLRANNFKITGLDADWIVLVDAKKSMCFGDSGGPLIVRGANAAEDVVVGLNRQMNPTCTPVNGKQYTVCLRTDSIHLKFQRVSDVLRIS